jgi:hypothetical protein
MQNGLPTYQYRPIASDAEIRVLTLEPATCLTDPLIASVFVRRLKDTDDPVSLTPTYHGVSYCWGTEQDWQWLQCDGQRLQITRNVDVMLRHLRKPYRPRNLWIDALCINQSDDIEKAKQVRAMGAIYEYAEKVHVWLGTATEGDRIPFVFRCLQKWALNAHQRPALDITTISESIVAALNAFMERPWFTRRWVLQEVKLAHDVMVHCGVYRLSWTWVRDGLAMLLSDHARRKPFFLHDNVLSARATHAMDGIDSLRVQGRGTTSIFDLLWDHHANICVDERDRIFALYGMLIPNIQASFNRHIAQDNDPFASCPVDYSRHFVSTYTQLATATIEDGYASVILTHALAFGTLAEQNPQWPSWVPSWHMARGAQSKIIIPNQDIFGLDQFGMVMVSKSITSPTLRLDGELDLITAIKEIDKSGGALWFCRAALPESYDPEASNTSGSAAALMFVNFISSSWLFLDRASFQFHSVFTKHDDSKWDERYMRHYSSLGFALEKEFHVRASTTVGYSIEALEREIDRLLQGRRIVQYTSKGEVRLCVAFTEVEIGDFIFRPNNKPRKDPTYALVVRRSRPLGRQEDPFLGTYRLVGCVMNHSASPEPDRIPESSEQAYFHLV